MNNFNSTGLKKKELEMIKKVSIGLSIPKSKIISLVKAGVLHPANKTISEFEKLVLKEIKL